MGALGEDTATQRLRRSIGIDDVHLLRAVAPNMGLPPTAVCAGRASNCRQPATVLGSRSSYPEWIGGYHQC